MFNVDDDVNGEDLDDDQYHHIGDDVNGDDLDDDQYRHWVLSVGGDKLRCKELLGAKSFRLRI